jgi:phosphoribosylformylglycinamidine synthase subunit PurS
LTEYLARIEVRLKPTVNDPQGNTVAHALGTLGFDEVEAVRVGKLIEVRLDAESSEEAHTRASAMATQLLANPVIELFKVAVTRS